MAILLYIDQLYNNPISLYLPLSAIVHETAFVCVCVCVCVRISYYSVLFWIFGGAIDDSEFYCFFVTAGVALWFKATQ